MISSLPKTAKDAIAIGERFYFTGKPCKHGLTKTENCKKHNSFEV